MFAVDVFFLFVLTIFCAKLKFDMSRASSSNNKRQAARRATVEASDDDDSGAGSNDKQQVFVCCWYCCCCYCCVGRVTANKTQLMPDRLLLRAQAFPEIVEVLNSLPEQYHDENYTPLLYVVQILKAQKSEELEGQLRDLQEYSEKLEHCMQQLVDVYFTGFNRSIKSYSDVLNCIGAAQAGVRQQVSIIAVRVSSPSHAHALKHTTHRSTISTQ